MAVCGRMDRSGLGAPDAGERLRRPIQADEVTARDVLRQDVADDLPFPGCGTQPWWPTYASERPDEVCGWAVALVQFARTDQLQRGLRRSQKSNSRPRNCLHSSGLMRTARRNSHGLIAASPGVNPLGTSDAHSRKHAPEAHTPPNTRRSIAYRARPRVNSAVTTCTWASLASSAHLVSSVTGGGRLTGHGRAALAGPDWRQCYEHCRCKWLADGAKRQPRRSSG